MAHSSLQPPACLMILMIAFHLGQATNRLHSYNSVALGFKRTQHFYGNAID